MFFKTSQNNVIPLIKYFIGISLGESVVLSIRRPGSARGFCTQDLSLLQDLPLTSSETGSPTGDQFQIYELMEAFLIQIPQSGSIWTRDLTPPFFLTLPSLDCFCLLWKLRTCHSAAEVQAKRRWFIMEGLKQHFFPRFIRSRR